MVLTKNGWGYIKLDVQCEAPFIKMKRGIITSDDFIGDVYELDYIIDDKLLHAGNNYAYIIISSYSHQEVIEITINGKEIVNDSGFDEQRDKNCKEQAYSRISPVQNETHNQAGMGY